MIGTQVSIRVDREVEEIRDAEVWQRALADEPAKKDGGVDGWQLVGSHLEVLVLHLREAVLRASDESDA